MFDVAATLMPALDRADIDLDKASQTLAHANAGDTSALSQAMAASARAALFSEALMNAVHARSAEIKMVTK